MAVDYDLVVIGATSAGIHAAVKAAQLKARVALVTQQVSTIATVVGYRPLLQVARTVQQVERAQQLGIIPRTAILNSNELGQQAESWAKATTRALSDRDSFPVVAAQGVEIVDGSGGFYRKPTLGFEVAARSLRSRRYLLTPASQPAIPKISGLHETGYLTADDLLPKLALLPKQSKLILLGYGSTAVELAQALNLIGFQVVLVTASDRLLPQQDVEITQLIQALLEAEGIQIFTHAVISQIRSNHKKWVEIGTTTLEADEIILATEKVPQTAGLNLAAAGVHLNKSAIVLDSRLRTTNPKVYACTNLPFLAGNTIPGLEQRYADLAVRNALFAPFGSKQYSDLLPAGVVATNPTCAWIGMTEASARSRYGKNVVILQQELQIITQAQLQGKTTGLCKLILRCDGEIVGAAIVGTDAQEWIGAIALAMQQKIPLQKLAQLPLPSPSFAEILQQTAQTWNQQRLAKNNLWQDVLTAWFNWRRSNVR
jgi:pyruvate/2-oxoglutarate dehydrogenase complex dihydrolipoamide dehydrogenase (E3) component